MLPHYCIITAQAIIVLLLMPKYFVQVLTDRENYFVKNPDHKSLVQQNNIFKKKVIFYQPDSSEQLPYCHKPILKTI